MLLNTLKLNTRRHTYLAMTLVLFCLILSFFYISTSSNRLSSDELFEMGQYYFNTSDSRDGAYDLEKAADFYRLALEKDAQPLAWYQLGRIDFLEGKFDEAIKKFQTQDELYGDLVPKVYYMLGLTYAYKAMGEEDDDTSWRYAEENFIKFISYIDTAPWPAVDLAWVYFMQGKYEDMKPVLEKSLELHPDNPWVLNMYGLALLNLEPETDGAGTYFLQAKNEAVNLTTQDWGNVYPGNNPQHWQQGLNEFITTIDKNLLIARSE